MTEAQIVEAVLAGDIRTCVWTSIGCHRQFIKWDNETDSCPWCVAEPGSNYPAALRTKAKLEIAKYTY